MKKKHSKKFFIKTTILTTACVVGISYLPRQQENTEPLQVTYTPGISLQDDTDSPHDPADNEITEISDLPDTFFNAFQSSNNPEKTQVPFPSDSYLAEIDDFRDEVASEAAKEAAQREKENKKNKENEEQQQEQNVAETDYTPWLTSTPDNAPAVIIDTDFASDADDVIAVRLALCFQDQKSLEVKGIALSTSYSRSPLAVHALCKQDGYGSIPVAMDTSGNSVQVHTDYVDVMYDMPKDRDDYEQPVQMYRRILSESDKKVNIITLGFLQNIEALMNSSPDRYSGLSGMELIAEKVDTVYIVGGNSTGRPSFNFYWPGEKGIHAAQTIARDFPARIVYLQTDLSDDTFCGQLYNAEDGRQRDIVTRALKANSQTEGVIAWDVFSVWCATQDMNGNLDKFYLQMEQGKQYISNTGASQWTATSEGRHFRIIKKQKGEYYSTLMNYMLAEKFDTTHG